MKGLAAATLESLHAADAAGCEPWLRSEISSVLTSADASLLDRLVEGAVSMPHDAWRRWPRPASSCAIWASCRA